MNADGSGQTNLTQNPNWDIAAVWSPDRRQPSIAFASLRDGNDEIYVMGSDGTGVSRRTNKAASDIDPSWSK